MPPYLLEYTRPHRTVSWIRRRCRFWSERASWRGGSGRIGENFANSLLANPYTVYKRQRCSSYVRFSCCCLLVVLFLRFAHVSERRWWANMWTENSNCSLYTSRSIWFMTNSDKSFHCFPRLSVLWLSSCFPWLSSSHITSVSSDLR